jgi:predicted nucleic acid-binding protein
MKGLTLDAGALIAFDRGQRQTSLLIWNTLKKKAPIAIPAGVLGQAWRDGKKQARLAKLLRSQGVEIEPLDERRARAAGQLCGVRGTSDIIDASVVLCAKRRGQSIVTSDAADMRRLDPSIELEEL